MSTTKNKLPVLTEREREVIEKLLNSLYDLTDSIQGDISTNQISWSNDLIDEIEVCCLGNKPDGDLQNSIAKDLENGEASYLNFEEAKQQILIRFRNMMDSIAL